MTLVIMAAGMGSRFGGLKQIEPVDKNGNFIIDYSIYDAIKAGYKKVVFIIKEENYDIFRDTVGKRIEDKIEVEYVFQKLEDVPTFVNIPESRVKPWGTSHAILACKDVVKEPFTVINADDFYGYEPFKKIKDFYSETRNDNEYTMVSYMVKNTMTENGSVKRGVCYKDTNNYLTKIVESSVERINNKIIATPLDKKDNVFEVEEDALVSMNFFGFTPSLFKYLNEEMDIFFEENKNNLENCEFLIPTSIFKLIKNNGITVKVLDTSSVWHGVTYKEDKDDLVNSIQKMIDEGIYPNNLWSK